MEYSDYELIKLSRDNDPTALDILIKKYTPMIHKVTSNYHVSGFDREDFFQEGQMAFIQAVKTYDLDEREHCSFYSYAFACVRNAVTTAFRRVKRHTNLDVLVDYTNPKSAIIAENAAYYYIEKDRNMLPERFIIETALKEGVLSEFEKICLKYYMMDNNYIEIASILSVSPKKVDNALQRCKMKLQNLKAASTGQYC